MKKLTEKQERFCREYIIDLNATQAAIRAGYSKNAADVQGARLLGNDKVQAYLQSLREKKSVELDITFERVALEIAKTAFGDNRNLFDENDRLKSMNDLDPSVSSTIKSITIQQEKIFSDGRTTVESTIKKVESYDKLKALELLSKMHGFFLKDNEQKGGDSQVVIFEIPSNGRD